VSKGSVQRGTKERYRQTQKVEQC